MSVMRTIERIVSFGPRWPGGEGDRPTVDYLAGELRSLGRETTVERITVRPSYQIALALLAALAVVGSVVSVSSPPLGVVILLLASIAIYADLTGRPSPVRWLTSPRDTANVSSPGNLPEAPNRIVLTAHHDAAHGGLLYARRRRRRGPSCYRDSRAASTSSSGLRSRHSPRRSSGSSAAGTRTRCRRSSSCRRWP